MTNLELMYYGLIMGLSCYLGAMGMKVLIDLIVKAIDWLKNKFRNK